MGFERKRKFVDDDRSDALTNQAAGNLVGMGAFVSQLRVSDLPPFSKSSPPTQGSIPIEDRGADGGAEHRAPDSWKTVSRKKQRAKRSRSPKKETANYPAISHSPNARLQSKTRIGDLQGLVLYLLADGTAPQWISVRHHHSIRKVVVVMVPGLEKGMFDGSIALESKDQQSADTSSPHDGLASAEVRSHPSPDDYYPVKLSSEGLPKPLRALADIFPHLWPVTTPGDDRYCRMHSPLHSMLTSPLPKSKEEKKHRGAQAPREGRDWENKRTRITDFIASAEELRDNGYALHPALLTTAQERADEDRRRHLNQDLTLQRWVDTDVKKLDEGNVADSEIQQGSLSAGRVILAMDCEMCRTEGGKLELTRVSIIGWDGDVILDELVKPARPITDYLTA